jgi:hypothetical protein
MKALKLGLTTVILIVAVTAPWFIHHRATVQLRTNEESLKEQASRLDELSSENERLSNTLAQVKTPPSLSEAQLTELLKLRNEVSQLRPMPGDMNQLQRQICRLHDRLQDAAIEEENGRDSDTTLLVEETQLRQTRVVRLKRWLEEMPEEKIPELQFVSEDRWTDRVDRPLITEDDYRSAIGLLRADGEEKFVPMTFQALKQYAKANNGQFPTDVSQLKPYFESPVDDAILQRYEIVPAKSLVQFLAETGGDWLLTQKTPVNKTFDQRFAVGLTSFRGTGGEGRWDPVQ